MAKPLTKIEHSVLNSTLRILMEAGGTTDHTDWMRGRGNAALLIQFINERHALGEKNPYEMTVEAQLAALHRANDEEQWGLTENDFTLLAASAPAWPKGKHAYRSFRIRFGEGDDGVASTFERHVARIKSVFTEKGFCRWELLHSGKIEYDGKPVERLRLLNGNRTHHAVVEWIVADLDTNRKRRSITAVRDAKSLADELLVIAWMFPDMIRAIDYDKPPGLFAAGYEANIPEEAKQEWQFVVVIGRNGVFFCSRSDNDSTFSVPRLRE